MYLFLKRVLTLFLLLLCTSALMAQQRTVTGTVRDTDGAALSGVTVLVKNSTTGTITDAQGKYTIQAGPANVLVFSFIGYASQEITVGSQSTVNVTLALETEQLGEVVVTALGVSRSTKALQSTVAKVGGENLTQAREINLGSSIQGRVAGVNVSNAGTGPAGSSRVIIRGNKSTEELTSSVCCRRDPDG